LALPQVETFTQMQARIPERIVEKAVKGMLPKGRLGRTLFTHMKVRFRSRPFLQQRHDTTVHVPCANRAKWASLLHRTYGVPTVCSSRQLLVSGCQRRGGVR
jgi:hypothetical protein